ncbi:retrovirus-related pol polyprotein from transposon TNT 1-94 [Tanacetum coccineum]
MTRSSTKELFTPFKDLEREFCSTRKLFKTPSLDDSSSPEFDIFFDLEEQSEGEAADSMEPTMEEYMCKTREDYGGSDNKDANEHIEKVLEIVVLFHIPEITQDQIMLRILNSKGAIPTMKAADAKTYDGLATIQAQLNNLGREIKKMNEKVYATKVGCESCEQNTDFEPNRSIVPFLSRLIDDSYEEMDVLDYATYLKKILRERPKMGYQIKASTNKNNLVVLEDPLPPKEKDPRSFTLPCYINNICFEKALEYLGASVSVMPLTTFTNLSLGELAPMELTVELADRTIKHPKGIENNILVGIGKFVFLVDFIILHMPEDVKVPLILERPFLSTTHAKIDVFKREITLRWTTRMFTVMRRWEMSLLENHFVELHVSCDSKDLLPFTMMRPLLKVSARDKLNGISHPYQLLKRFYKGILNLGHEYVRDEKMEEWLTRKHVSMHEME